MMERLVFRLHICSDLAGPTASEESIRAATWDLVSVAASQPPSASSNVNTSAPEALFHLLDKTLLLKHLRELKAEKTVNGKPFYKSYVFLIRHHYRGKKICRREKFYSVREKFLFC
jgi:hypothetical protein